MILDAVDVVIADILWMSFGLSTDLGFPYHALDKWLDMYYLSFELIVSLRWTNNLARNTSIALFFYRLIGVIAFEITGIRKILFFVPNLFENFFLYCAATIRLAPKLVPKNYRQLAIVLFLLYIPKFGQEWVLHFKEMQPWDWIKNTFLGLN